MGSKTGHTAQGHWGLAGDLCWIVWEFGLSRLFLNGQTRFKTLFKTIDWVDFRRFLGEILVCYVKYGRGLSKAVSLFSQK